MAIPRVIVFLCLCRIGLTQIQSNGSCPQIEPMQNFDIHRFLGKWYEIGRYTIPYHDHAKCVSFDFSLRRNNKTVVFVQNRTSTLTGIRTCEPYIVKTADPNNRGILRIESTWSSSGVYLTVLGTDYDSYVVTCQCKNDESTATHWLTGWIWARDRNQYESVMVSVDPILKKATFDSKKFIRIKHADCEVRPVSYPVVS